MKINKKGFTLIEMIVVLAILSILAMIVAPSLTAYIQRAKDASYDANARICYEIAVAAQASYEVGMIDNIYDEIYANLNAQAAPGGRCLVSHHKGPGYSDADYIDLKEDNSETFAKLSIDKAVWITGKDDKQYRGIYATDPIIKTYFKR